jgi:hypothetical protein
MRYSDLIHHGTWVAFYWRDPFSIFNNFYLNTNYWMYWNFSGELLSAYANFNFNSQFKNRWGMNGSFSRWSKNISTSLLRGGPSMTMPGGEEMNLNVNTDETKKISFEAGTYHNIGDEASNRYHEYWMGVDARPLNALSVSFNPSYSRQNNMLQYVSTTVMKDDPRYVFARMEQKTLSFTFRLNYTLNPELTLEYYGEPFVSAGKYTEFKRITVPDADAFEARYRLYAEDEIVYSAADNVYSVDEDADGAVDYSFDNPDFNFRQFRSNLVIRWEYLPGSTLYLVWSQGRTSNAASGMFSYGEDMRQLFDIVAHNVFLLKFSYWFSL